MKPAQSQADVPADFELLREGFPDFANVVRVLNYRPFTHSANVTSMQFTDGDKTLVTGTLYGARIWDAETKRLLREIPAKSLNSTLVATSPDGKLLVIAGDRGDVRAVDRSSDKDRIVTTPADFGDGRYITKIALSPDGTRLAIGFRRWSWSDLNRFTRSPNEVTEGGVEIWDLIGRKRVISQNDADGAVIAVNWSPSGEFLAVGRIDGLIKFLKPDGKPHGSALTIPDLDSPVGLDFDSTGSRLACVTVGGSITVWRVGEDRPVWHAADPRRGKLVWQNSPGDVVFDDAHHLVFATSLLRRADRVRQRFGSCPHKMALSVVLRINLAHQPRPTKAGVRTEQDLCRIP